MAMKKKGRNLATWCEFLRLFNTHESRFQCHPMIVYVPWKSEYKKKEFTNIDKNWNWDDSIV